MGCAPFTLLHAQPCHRRPALQEAMVSMHPTPQVEGFWYTRQLGSTDRSVIEEGGSYRCYMSSIRVLDNGNVNVTYFHR